MDTNEKEHWKKVYTEFIADATTCTRVSELLMKYGMTKSWGDAEDEIGTSYGIEFEDAIFTVTQQEGKLLVGTTFEIQDETTNRPATIDASIFDA